MVGHTTTLPMRGPAERENVSSLDIEKMESMSHTVHDNSIAIVGMAMRLPGGIRTAEEFWGMMINKRDCSSEVPKNRYNIDGFYSPDKPQSVRTKRGYFLDDDYIGKSDTAFFRPMGGISGSELDPQGTMLMEVVWECMENAGQCDWQGKEIGCYVGAFGEDWHELMAKDSQVIPRVHAFSNGGFALSNRVSYEFDLKGPSMTISTACSSSLTALHEACQALRGGSCSSAIVAGTNMLLTPSMTINMSENMVLSPDGRCKAFDAKADGYARGEAVNAVYLKPLKQALSDGDEIRAVIRATSANYDGRTDKIVAPDIASQERVMRQAYHQAKIDNITDTAFVECHGTGTQVGDLVETTAIARTFHPDGVYIGSVKSNVGHGEGASGLTAIIKAVLALEHSVIPPNMHFNLPNPKIPFEKGHLRVPTESTPWPSNRSKRVGVNCFGIGGSNVHAILESISVCKSTDRARKESLPLDHWILPLSAHSKSGLEARMKETKAYIKKNPGLVGDVAYTLGARRDRLTHRAYMLANNGSAIDESRYSNVSGPSDPNLIYVFTGQGSMWSGMGNELMEAFVDFKKDIQLMDRILQELETPPEWSIEAELKRLDGNIDKHSAEHSQTLVAAIQLALVNLFKAWGIQASAVIGHSSGEVIAAYAANAIPLRSALLVAHFRGRCVKAKSHPGGMAVIGISATVAKQYLEDGVAIACENSPENVNISGRKDKLDKVVRRISDDLPGTFIRYVSVEVAYHSPDIQCVGAFFESCIEPFIVHNKSMLPMYSTVTGISIANPAQLNAAYWRKNMESPVMFSTAVQAAQLEKMGSVNIFVEIGPHASLSGPLRQIFSHSPGQNYYVPTILKGKSQVPCLLKTCGELFLHDYPVKIGELNSTGNMLTDLPVYPWDRQDIGWQESRLSQNWRFRKFHRHELLGSRTLEGSDMEPSWRNLLSVRNVDWLGDHRVSGEIVFPCAAYIAMINEAIRQLCDTQECTIRNLQLHAPLVLDNIKTVELITSSRPQRISDRLHSTWHEFSIMSCIGTKWTKHAVALAKPGMGETKPAPPSLKSCCRSVFNGSWYSSLEKVGLEYGPMFRGLQDIAADPLSFTAIATLHSPSQDSGNQSMHPTTIDQCLQLFSAAICKGRTALLNKLYIPMSIDQIQIGQSTTEMKASAWGSGLSVNQTRNFVTLMAHDECVLSMQDVRFVELGSPKENHSEAIPLASYMEWQPDIDLIPNHDQLLRTHCDSDNIRSVLRLALISVIQIHRHLATLDPDTISLRRYKQAIQDRISLMENGKLFNTVEMHRYTHMCHDSLNKERDTLSTSLNSNSLGFIPSLSQHVLDTVPKVSGDPTQTCLDEISQYTKEYEEWTSATSSLSKWFCVLRHSNPSMKILEIGAGEGSLSANILEDFTTNDLHFYSLYTLTSTTGISTDVVNRLRQYQKLEFKTLDISRDPLDQGFQNCTYDLVIASDLSSLSPKLETALHNIKQLLSEKGRLLIREKCQSLSVVNYACKPSFHEDYVSKDIATCSTDERASLDVWDTALRNAGFDGISGHDIQPPYQLHYHITTQVASDVSHRGRPDRPINLLCATKKHTNTWICEVEAALTHKGYDIRRCTLGEGIPKNEPVISLLDCDGPFFKDISEERWRLFQSLVNSCPHILWVTPSVELNCSNPDFAMVLGISRTARQEQGLHFGTCQIQSFDRHSATALVDASKKYFEQTQQGTDEIDPDYEFLLRGELTYVPRAHWTSLQDQLLRYPKPDAHLRLDINSYGIIDSLCWAEDHPSSSLGPDDVEVDIKYVGVNFRDIMISLGIMADKDEFGVEASGIVRRCGENVTRLKAGDRVIVARPGLFRTVVTLPAIYCTALPTSLSMEDAATMAVAYVTTLYSLCDIARVEKGQSVLVHAACGGVGLAALHVCRMLGAEIYATVGSEQKIRYLTNELGIARDHIFSSRDDSFLPGLMYKTGGRGVDVVLNSLSGELLHASWKCVAEFGKMIELGKRDFMEHGTLGLEAFGGNRAFIGVDLIRLAEEKPGLISRLANQFLGLYEKGKIPPIRPVNVVPASKVHEVFRSMQQGLHMGKIVLQMPESNQDCAVGKSISRVSLSPDLAYLLVGGLGGVGRALATWMVDRGARNLVFLSRSAGDSLEDQQFIRELAVQGCNAIMARGDVTKLADVKSAIQRCPYPIGGVLQLSMVIRDQFIPDMTHKNWQDGIGPKVTGTWNLHHALSGNDAHLHFFVLCGSITGIMGNAGQVNYSSANSFLTSFAQYRLQNSLVASVIDLGGVDDMGFLATKDTKLRDRMRSASVRLLSEQEVVDAFEASVLQSSNMTVSAAAGSVLRPSNDLIVGMSSTKSLADPSVRPLWGRDARFKMYANFDINKRTDQRSNDGIANIRHLAAILEQQPGLLDDPAKRDGYVAEIIKLFQEYSTFTRDLEPGQVAAMPIDSLMTVEIRNWAVRYLKLDISLMAIAKAGTIGGLANLVLSTLRAPNHSA